MKYNPVTRRHFLQGLGGSLMALPILPSLIPKAQAQTAPFSPKFLVMVGSGHGGTGYSADWYPRPVVTDINSGLLTARNLFSSQPSSEVSHQFREGSLQQMLTADPGHAGGNVDGGNARTSFVLGSFLNPVVGKMNLLRGIDGGMFYSGHSTGMYAGNIKMAVNNVNARNQMENWPTLDQFLASSDRFYQPGEDISDRVILFGDISYLSNGTLASSGVNRISGVYNSIFSKYENSQDPAVIAERSRQQFLLDKVFEDFQRLTRGAYGPGRTLSSEDRIRVDIHSDFLRDLQRKTQTIINTCSDVTEPQNSNNLWFTTNRLPNGFNDLPGIYDVYTDLIVAAFQCGASRLAAIEGGVKSAQGGDSYHDNIAHRAEFSSSAQLTHNQNFRWQAEHIVGALARKMDSFQVGSTGRTILDHGLVLWTHENGYTTHAHHSLGMVSFGSLDGFFQTGKYLDYRNHNNMGIIAYSDSDQKARPGIPIQRIWANILLGMGFTPAEFERHGRRGYSDTSLNTYPDGSADYHRNHIAYPTSMVNSLSSRIPGLSS